MDVKFCLLIERAPYADEQLAEQAQEAISDALEEYDCGSMDVPELGDEECWVFYATFAGDDQVAKIDTWIKTVLSTIEQHTRRLSDGEWVVVIDRSSLFS